MQATNLKSQQVTHSRDSRSRSVQSTSHNIQKDCTHLVAKEEQLLEPNQDHIKVYLRIKKVIPSDSIYSILDRTSLVCKVPDGSHLLRNTKVSESVTKKYTFSEIFGPEDTEANFFDCKIEPNIRQFISGTNCTFLMHGGSKSGKTDTLIGAAEDPGLIPRSLEYLFQAVPSLSQKKLVKPFSNGNVVNLEESACKEEEQKRNILLKAAGSLPENIRHIETYKSMQKKLVEEAVEFQSEPQYSFSSSAWISFVEICNEQIYDLLQPPPLRGTQRTKLQLGTSKGTTHIKNHNSVSIASGLEAFQILQYGINNSNTNSSKSHSILTIKLAQISESDKTSRVSCLNFVNLLGNDKQKKSINPNDRSKESFSANASLLVLGRCIKGIRNAQSQNDKIKLIPFRESKLTQLFQRALSGFENISMIVNINPSKDTFDENNQVLNFSALTKSITVDNHLDNLKDNKNNSFSLYMHDNEPLVKGEKERLNDMINQLQTEIEEQRNEYETNEAMSRNNIIDGYKEILKETNDYWQKQLNNIQNNCKAVCELKFNDMQKHYEGLLKESTCSNVINLDDSSDNEEVNNLQKELDEYKKTLQEQQKILAKLQTELMTVKFETKSDNSDLEAKFKNLTKENEQLKIKNAKLENTLKDATQSYEQLRKDAEMMIGRVGDLLAERLELKDRVVYLEEQLCHQILWKRGDTDDPQESR